MSGVIIHTYMLSPYGWTARYIAEEKGLDYRVVDARAATPSHRALHPFGKVPVLQHGDIVVYETLAIAHYLDRAFPGPALQPVDFLGQTDVLRWVSIVNAYVFPVMKRLIEERMAGSWRTEPPDEALIASLQAPMAEQLAVIEQALSANPFLVGHHLTIADTFLFPLLHFASFTPEGTQALAKAPAAQRWLGRMRARPSFEATDPFGVKAAERAFEPA
jgi:glutathione S-transferase